MNSVFYDFKLYPQVRPDWKTVKIRFCELLRQKMTLALRFWETDWETVKAKNDPSLEVL